MVLFTKSIIKQLEKKPLYSTEGQGMKANVIVKIFNPFGAGTWLITEGEKQENGDWLLFGYFHLHEWEWGYVLMSDLVNTRIGCYRLRLEREMYQKGTVEDFCR